jgi:hypothetical protein
MNISSLSREATSRFYDGESKEELSRLSAGRYPGLFGLEGYLFYLFPFWACFLGFLFPCIFSLKSFSAFPSFFVHHPAGNP